MNVQNDAVHSITALNNWFICNKLSLNLSKTCYMTFFANTASHCNLIVNGQTIEKVNSCKYLNYPSHMILSNVVSKLILHAVRLSLA